MISNLLLNLLCCFFCLLSGYILGRIKGKKLMINKIGSLILETVTNSNKELIMTNYVNNKKYSIHAKEEKTWEN